MLSAILPVFALGLLSGLHCLQMCGPIVLAYSLQSNRLQSHLAYNAGRILTYSLLGAIAGAAGTGLQLLGQLAGLAAAARRLLHGGKFRLGLTLGFLPCGLVYAALLKSIDAGSPFQGALTMMAFGAGTSAALLGVGAASSFAGPRLGGWSSRLAAVSVMLFGAILLWRGLAAKPLCHG